MLLTDVNVLLYAFREDSADHARYKEWLETLMSGEESYGVSELVLSAFLRIVSHPRIYDPPTPIGEALTFASLIRAQPNCSIIEPGERHWEIFSRLCLDARATGKLVPDAYLAALAIESGSEWITTDGDFARFPGLRWRRPF